MIVSSRKYPLRWSVSPKKKKKKWCSESEEHHNEMVALLVLLLLYLTLSFVHYLVLHISQVCLFTFNHYHCLWKDMLKLIYWSCKLSNLNTIYLHFKGVYLKSYFLHSFYFWTNKFVKYSWAINSLTTITQCQRSILNNQSLGKHF